MTLNGNTSLSTNITWICEAKCRRFQAFLISIVFFFLYHMIFAFKCHQSCIDCLLKKQVRQKVTLKQLKHVFGGQQGMTLTNFHPQNNTMNWNSNALEQNRFERIWQAREVRSLTNTFFKIWVYHQLHRISLRKKNST